MGGGIKIGYTGKDNCYREGKGTKGKIREERDARGNREKKLKRKG